MQIDKPMQCIVSDMTAFYVKGIYHELTLYMDLWNNEIVSHSLSAKRGDRMTYISGLEDLIAWKEQHPEHQMILHSDQGSVYASKAYNDLLPMYGITRSMSRAGTPTGLSIVLCTLFFNRPCRTYASRPTCAHPFRVGCAHSTILESSGCSISGRAPAHADRAA